MNARASASVVMVMPRVVESGFGNERSQGERDALAIDFLCPDPNQPRRPLFLQSGECFVFGVDRAG